MADSRHYEFESLSISGGDEWTVEELTAFLGHIYVLYNRIAVLKEPRPKKPAHLSRQLYGSKSRVHAKEKVIVSSLSIRSPMNLNLQGIGEIIHELREGIKDFYRNPRERQMLDQQLEEHAAKMKHDADVRRIELMDSQLKLMRNANRTFDELGLSDEDKLASLKAIFDPANDAARIVEKKNLTID